MGDIVLGNGEQCFSTVLGSCIAIMLHDPIKKLGGMAHILLPQKRSPIDENVGKYADAAVPAMLEQMIRLGCETRKVWAKLAGGATMLSPNSNFQIGERNLIAVREALGNFSVPVLAAHCGGSKGRRALFYPGSGKIIITINGESGVEI